MPKERTKITVTVTANAEGSYEKEELQTMGEQVRGTVHSALNGWGRSANVTVEVDYEMGKSVDVRVRKRD